MRLTSSPDDIQMIIIIKIYPLEWSSADVNFIKRLVCLHQNGILNTLNSSAWFCTKRLGRSLRFCNQWPIDGFQSEKLDAYIMTRSGWRSKSNDCHCHSLLILSKSFYWNLSDLEMNTELLYWSETRFGIESVPHVTSPLPRHVCTCIMWHDSCLTRVHRSLLEKANSDIWQRNNNKFEFEWEWRFY